MVVFNPNYLGDCICLHCLQTTTDKAHSTCFIHNNFENAFILVYLACLSLCILNIDQLENQSMLTGLDAFWNYSVTVRAEMVDGQLKLVSEPTYPIIVRTEEDGKPCNLRLSKSCLFMNVFFFERTLPSILNCLQKIPL